MNTHVSSVIMIMNKALLRYQCIHIMITPHQTVFIVFMIYHDYVCTHTHTTHTTLVAVCYIVRQS